MLDRTISPDIKNATEFDLKLKPYRLEKLDNGVEVYIIEAGTQEVLTLDMVFDAGNWYDTSPLVAAATNFLLINGTKEKTAFQINEHFEYYGSFLSRNCYNETATLTLHTPSKHLSELLPVIAEIMTDSVFPEEELAIYKQNMKQRLEVNLKKCDVVAGRLIDAAVFGEQHPYGRYSYKEQYDGLTRENITEHYKRYYLNGRCRIFVGGVLPANFTEQLNKYFGQLSINSNQPPSIEHPYSPSNEKKYRIINDPNGVQGAVRLARQFPNRHHPDFQKVQLLNTLFGGYFGSRLMSNIREDKGYTYGIHSYIQNHIGDTAWMVSTEAGRDVCEATIQEIYNEMELLRNEPADEEELQLVRNYILGSTLGDLDGPFHILARWKNLVLNGLTDEYFYRSLRIIKETTAEELQSLAQKYLQPDDFYEMIVV
jgi:predicted Zn-dependent peptidase